MEWRGRRGSRNIEDRRGRGGASRAGGVGGIGLLAILAIGYFLGVDVTPFLQQGALEQPSSSSGPRELTPEEQARGQFVSVVLADTEEIWASIFQRQVGRPYSPPVLVLYSNQTSSPCGGASGATGPFYCPADKKIYIDTAFFVTMERKMGAGGDFAAAYVVAHEVAHHVQNELGILGQARQIQRQVSEADANAISVRLELQADCYSGLWARAAEEVFGTIEPGDLQEAVNAARQVGDDTIQRNAGRVPMPHTFTHGTSEQRARWFAKGYKQASLPGCDTFGTNQL